MTKMCTRDRQNTPEGFVSNGGVREIKRRQTADPGWKQGFTEWSNEQNQASQAPASNKIESATALDTWRNKFRKLSVIGQGYSGTGSECG